MDTFLTVLQIGAFVIAGASVAAAGIAPLTKNQTDDKISKALTWLHSALSKIALNKVR